MKNKFICINIFCLFFIAMSVFGTKAIDPEDVLPVDEINKIVVSKNFFLRDHMVDEKPIWNHLDRKYTQHFMKTRTQFYTLEDVVDETLKHGFPVHYKIEELYRADMNRHIAIGKILPRLSLTVGEGINIVNINNLFINLFGFLLPNNWLTLIQANKANKATEYLFLKTVLDQHYAAEVIYLDLHQLIQDLEINSFYLAHMQILDRYLTAQGRLDEALAGKAGVLGTDMGLKRGSIRLRFDDLAEVMALKVDKEGHYAADHINIFNVDNFPQRVQALEELDGFYHDKEAFVEEVLKRSVELKSINEFYKAAKLGVGITAFGNILEGRDSPNDNLLRLGINFGYDTIPRLLVSKSAARTAKIDVENQLVQMIEMARRAFDVHLNSMGAFAEAQRSMKINRQAFSNALKNIVDHNMSPDGRFLFHLTNLMESEYKLNNALHISMKAHAAMRRLLLVEEKKYLENNGRDKINSIQEYYSSLHSNSHFRRSRIDKFTRKIYKPKDLRELLDGNIADKKNQIYNLDKNTISELVTSKIHNLTRRKVINNRSADYYRILHDYVALNNIDLDKKIKSKLIKRSRQKPILINK